MPVFRKAPNPMKMSQTPLVSMDCRRSSSRLSSTSLAPTTSLHVTIPLSRLGSGQHQRSGARHDLRAAQCPAYLPAHAACLSRDQVLSEAITWKQMSAIHWRSRERIFLSKAADVCRASQMAAEQQRTLPLRRRHLPLLHRRLRAVSPRPAAVSAPPETAARPCLAAAVSREPPAPLTPAAPGKAERPTAAVGIGLGVKCSRRCARPGGCQLLTGSTVRFAVQRVMMPSCRASGLRSLSRGVFSGTAGTRGAPAAAARSPLPPARCTCVS